MAAKVNIGKASRDFMLKTNGLTAVRSLDDYGRSIGKARSAKIALSGHNNINRSQPVSKKELFHMYSDNRSNTNFSHAESLFNDFSRNANIKHKNNYQSYARPKDQLMNDLIITGDKNVKKYKINGAAKETAENAAKESDKLMSKLGKYAPAAFGFATTAWLVNKLSDKRGQQSNAQLYGQQQYY